MGVDQNASSEMLDVVGGLYDAALDPTAWAGMASRLAGAFGATSAVVKLHGADARVQLVEATANLDAPQGRLDWAAYWHERDLWVQRSVAYGMSRIVTSEELVSKDEAEHSGFYREWLAALDIHYMIGAVFAADDGAVGVLGIHRPRQGEAFDAEGRRRAALILPHLQRALKLRQRLGRVVVARDGLLDALEQVDTGMIVVNGSGTVRHMNRCAEAILARTPELIVAAGRLGASAPATMSRLLDAIARATEIARGSGMAASSALRIERAGRAAVTLSVGPVGPRWAAGSVDGPLVLVMLRDPEHPPLHIDHLRTLFGFTRMEAITASELARGRSLEEISAALGIGLGTVRSHIKQVLRKTGAVRQAQAVAMLARSVAMISD